MAGTPTPAGPELRAFAAAAVTRSEDLPAARDVLRALVGDAGLVEAAATVSVFEGLNRIADATGIQLDDGLDADTSDFRADLGIANYAGAESTGDRAIAHVRSPDVAGLFS